MDDERRLRHTLHRTSPVTVVVAPIAARLGRRERTAFGRAKALPLHWRHRRGTHGRRNARARTRGAMDEARYMHENQSHQSPTRTCTVCSTLRSTAHTGHNEHRSRKLNKVNISPLAPVACVAHGAKNGAAIMSGIQAMDGGRS